RLNPSSDWAAFGSPSPASTGRNKAGPGQCQHRHRRRRLRTTAACAFGRSRMGVRLQTLAGGQRQWLGLGGLLLFGQESTEGGLSGGDFGMALGPCRLALAQDLLGFSWAKRLINS